MARAEPGFVRFRCGRFSRSHKLLPRKALYHRLLSVAGQAPQRPGSRRSAEHFASICQAVLLVHRRYPQTGWLEDVSLSCIRAGVWRVGIRGRGTVALRAPFALAWRLALSFGADCAGTIP